MTIRTILLYGQSMLLSLVGDNLAKCTDMHVVQADAWEEVDALATDCTPDVLIYDLADASVNNILPLLFKNPLLLLIGLDTETNRAFLLAGKETRLLTLERIKEIVLTY